MALRVAIPLLVLAAAGHDLPGLPPYDYAPLNGDATGFYAEARELISAAFGPAGAAALLLLAAGAFAVWRLRRSWVAIPVGCLAVSLAASVLVLDQQTTGAAVVGWPLLWSIPLFPFRVGRRARRRRRVRGRAAALARRERGHRRRDRLHRPARDGQPRGRHRSGGALRALAAADAAARGNERLGERPVERRRRAPPLHRAALDRARRGRDRAPARAGARPGPARDGRGAARVRDRRPAFERVLRRRRDRARWRCGSGSARTLPAAAAGLAFVPLLAVYWPKGYPTIDERPRLLARPGRSHLGRLAALRPAHAARPAPARAARRSSPSPRWQAALLGAAIATNAVLYTFYEHTHLHPRFLYVTLPALFVLQAAGAWLVIRKAFEGRRERGL